MDSPSMIAPEQTNILNISPEDRLSLLTLQAEFRIREQELALARVRLDASRAISDAAADRVLAKIGVPSGASDVTIDLNGGVVSYLLPASA